MGQSCGASNVDLLIEVFSSQVGAVKGHGTGEALYEDVNLMSKTQKQRAKLKG